ncbi:hypothetical protein jhhlp_004986 [Lomentospora prolificans]|uniref:Uncharacterized protein n=1 Tax=Lomentospora prolificans TaxID=41688 RepID=A0A2N3N825_9PEZI|nr:hypothetical protein jhhlp_004986 [Lomentospora prolificans]
MVLTIDEFKKTYLASSATVGGVFAIIADERLSCGGSLKRTKASRKAWWGRRKFLLARIAGILVSRVVDCVLQEKYVGTDNEAGLNAAVFLFTFIIF